jgi:hypothetical protein
MMSAAIAPVASHPIHDRALAGASARLASICTRVLLTNEISAERRIIPDAAT